MDLSTESDALLLARMGQTGDPDGSRAAWGEFYRRHRDYLYAVCLKACRHGDRRESARDLHTATFQRAYEAAATFRSPQGRPPSEIQSLVRAWLGQIASRIAIDQIRGMKGEKAVFLDQSEWQAIREKPGRCDSQHTPDVCRVLNDELDEREQDVIRTTFVSYDPDRDNQKLSTEEIRALAARWETTPENIRQIRKRALAKLKKALLAKTSGASSEGTGP